MRAGATARAAVGVAVLDLDADDLARWLIPADQPGEEVAPAAGRLQDPGPAPADRPELIEHRGDQVRRGLKIAEVPTQADLRRASPRSATRVRFPSTLLDLRPHDALGIIDREQDHLLARGRGQEHAVGRLAPEQAGARLFTTTIVLPTNCSGV